MTSNIRKALFKALMAQSIENENTVIIDNGEEVMCTMYMYLCEEETGTCNLVTLHCLL